jgi:hypothetical protein
LEICNLEKICYMYPELSSGSGIVVEKKCYQKIVAALRLVISSVVLMTLFSTLCLRYYY